MDFLKIGKIFAQEYYAIPDYQRDYEWKAAQNSTLLDDVLQIAKDTTPQNHFFGAIVTIPYEEGAGINKSIDFSEYGVENTQVKHVVDGQQRLTSFSILIRALQDLIMKDPSVSVDFKNKVSRQLENILLGNDYKGANPAPRLILNGNTGNCYNNELLKISNESYNKTFRGAKRILDAYGLFSVELTRRLGEFLEEGICKSPEEYYLKVITTITNKVVFVEIECDASSNAFQVFDSLNGKGLDLTAADRIKNIFMSWSPKGKGAQKWDAIVSDIGEDYLANFFVSLFFYNTKKRISKNKLPEQFGCYKNEAIAEFDEFFNSLRADGLMYGNLRRAKTVSKEINSLIVDFQALKMDQIYVILFAIIKVFGEEIVKSKDFVEFVRTLQKLIVRMQVCEKSTNRLDSLFATWIDLVKDKSAPITLITQRIKDEIQINVDDNLFETAFARFNPSDNKVAEYYLRQIEDYMRKENKNRSPVEKNLTVEHIIPQTLDDLSVWYGSNPIPDEIAEDFKQSVVENIGNKALLYGDDNTSASNNVYESKLEVYKSGKSGQDKGTPLDTFQLIKDLLSNCPERFIHADVYERAKRLATYAKMIW